VDAHAADHIAPADDLPLDNASFDAALATQVLEHVPDPLRVMREMHRVVRPGGSVLVTVPFVWEEHEKPFDFQRFSSAGLVRMLEDAGFAEIAVQPRNDYLTTLAQLMRNARWALGRAPDGLDDRRLEVAELLDGVAARLTDLAPLDVSRVFPLGWEATAWRT
jgi:SAM-dependent methyltransferase